MDWLRRNWPDLLIGLALIAVIAGIVATLLTGGSFFPFDDDAPTATTPPPAVSTPAPADAGTSADTPAADADAGAGLDAPSVAVLPPSDPGSDGVDAAQDALAAPPGAPDPDVNAADAPDGDATAPDALAAPAVVPATPGDAASAADAPAASDSATSTPAASAASTPAGAASSAPAPTAAASSTPAASAGDLPTDPYRVSVGAFGLRENAEAQAARFRADGFPVFLGTQGELTIVLVGPYVEEAEARRVADRIRQGGYDVDPIIYRFDPDADAGGAASPAPAPAAPAPAAVAAPAAAPSVAAATGGTDGVRLQVGAYGDRAGATPQIERLVSLGFDVSTVEEGGLVKVVIGPFSGQALDDARIILDGAGIESFAR